MKKQPLAKMLPETQSERRASKKKDSRQASIRIGKLVQAGRGKESRSSKRRGDCFPRSFRAQVCPALVSIGTSGLCVSMSAELTTKGGHASERARTSRGAQVARANCPRRVRASELGRTIANMELVPSKQR